MSKLSDFYDHKAFLKKSGEFSDINEVQWDALEEKLIREETLPQLLEQIAPIIGEVQIPLSISINFNPGNGMSLSMTRNCVLMSFPINQEQRKDPVSPKIEKEPYTPVPPHPVCLAEKNTSQPVEQRNYSFAEKVPTSTNVFKKKRANHIVFTVFRLLNEKSLLDRLIPYLRQIGDRPNRSLEIDDCLEFGNILLVSTLDDVKKRNNPIPRWFECPLSIAGLTMFLSTQWRNNDAKIGLQYKSFIKMIDIVYPSMFSFSEDNGYYVLTINALK